MSPTTSEQQELAWLHQVRRAVSVYADARLEAYGRKVVHALQRKRAVEHGYKTAWDEYCRHADALYNLQDERLELAIVISQTIGDVAEAIPNEEAILLCVGGAWEDDDCLQRAMVPRDDAWVRDGIERAVYRMADRRSMHFDL